MNALKTAKEHWMLIGITVVITSTILIAAGILFHESSKMQRNNEPIEEKLIDEKLRELDQLLAIIDKIWKEREIYIKEITNAEEYVQSQMKDYTKKAEITDAALLEKINNAFKTIANIDNLMRKTMSKADYDYMMMKINGTKNARKQERENRCEGVVSREEKNNKQ